MPSSRASSALGAVIATNTSARAPGKTPIVVKDAPGFLVNRLLVAYLLAFSQIVQEEADIQQVDAAMEGFGWPMGPAYLADVIGLDTMSRITEVVARGFPNGLGFPKHVGGPLKYADSLGLATIVSASECLAPLGPIHRVSERMKEMAAEGASYYGKA